MFSSRPKIKRPVTNGLMHEERVNHPFSVRGALRPPPPTRLSSTKNFMRFPTCIDKQRHARTAGLNSRDSEASPHQEECQQSVRRCAALFCYREVLSHVLTYRGGWLVKCGSSSRCHKDRGMPMTGNERKTCTHAQPHSCLLASRTM